ncbi:MAG: hypothetical protein LQ338_007750 [Usnochroma carphineum]|nr:MAG: hypothetical protein LQ338_007750 [Usnochroma carphineum]
MSGGPSIVRRPVFEKSNVELVNGLRANFAASKEASTPIRQNGQAQIVDGCDSTDGDSIPYSFWTSLDNDLLHIPSKVFQVRGLSEERSQYDITVKLFLLPKTSFSDWRRHFQEAITAVLEELDVESVDLLIVSFPGISFDADSEKNGGCGSNRVEASESDLMDAAVDAWEEVEFLYSRGVALKIGVAEFGPERLQKFLPKTMYRPTVDQINVRDCHVLPRSMMLFAKQENLELLTHNDCTDILPQGTLRDLLGTGENGAGVLAGPNPGDRGLKGDVTPQWVVKYTAVVRDRGVIENKGYFASAELSDETSS